MSAISARALELAREYDATRADGVAHELGQIELVAGRDSASQDRAVSLLRLAAERDPTSASYAVDLSAALLARYASRRLLRDVMEAVDVVAPHVQRDRGACWNYAVGLAWLSVRTGGDSVRAQCARLCEAGACPGPNVVDEAPLPAANERTVAMAGHWADATWEYIWLDALPRWARGERTGDTVAARRAMGDVRAAASVLARRRVDSSGFHALKDIEQASNDPERRGALARAFELFAEGRRSSTTGTGRDIDMLLDSVRRLTYSTDELRQWVSLQRANQLLVSGKPGAALTAYRAQRAQLGATRTILTERLLFNEALGLMGVGKQFDATDTFELAAERCRELQRPECVLAAATMAANLAMRARDDVRRERNLQVALEANVGPITGRRWGVLSELWQLAESYRADFAKHSLLSEALSVARAIGRSDLVMEDLVVRSGQHLRDTNWVALRTDVAEARRLWATGLAPSYQRVYAPDLSWLSGELLLREGDRSALDSLDRAIAALRADTNAVRLLKPMVAHAKAVLLVGDSARALAELDSLLGATSRLALSSISTFRRARLVDVSRDAGVLAASVLRRRGDVLGVYRALSGQPFLPVTGSSTEAGTTARYAVRRLGDSVLVWTRPNGAWEVEAVYLPEAVVRRASTQLDSVGLAVLYDGLMRRAVARMPARITQLRIDVRGELSSIPWPALRDSRTGEYLIERFAIRRTDNVFASLPNDHPSPARVLIVDAAPRNGPRALPGAAAESRAIGAVWGRSSRRDDGSDGVPGVLTALSSATIVHFAGHAVYDRVRPDQSYLLVPSVAGDSLLSADRLSSARLGSVDLMILSACETQGAGSGAGGGFDSLAGAARLAGARQIIAALWPVDDAVTAELMRGLHERLHSGDVPAVALRAVQIASLRSADAARRKPRAWAAFQLLGN